MFSWHNWFRTKPKEPPIRARATMQRDTVHVFAGDAKIESFRWSDVVTIRAWKQDCYATDRIWIGFDIQGRDEAVCVHEEMEGYKHLIAEMQTRCPEHLASWWSAVAYPAFATNYTVIWERSTPEQPASLEAPASNPI